MTRREEQMRDRIRSVEEQLVKAAILLTEARERAEAAEKERDKFRKALECIEDLPVKIITKAYAIARAALKAKP